MPEQHISLIKLCVGAESVEDLESWIKQRIEAGGQGFLPRHVTRMWPKKAESILRGGSLYWVIKGFVQARQKVLRLEEVIGEDGIRRCAIVMDPELIRTTAAPRRPFQGWRYLKPEDAPTDLPLSRTTDDALPDELERALADIGLR